MKHLMTLVALLVSTAAVAQIPTLPWNPDENGDQFIGLPDLLGLLTVYGQDFENAIVAEDGESAIMYMGELSYFECEHSCYQLPGFWTLPSAADLVPVYSELHAGGNYDYTYTWVDKRDYDVAWNRFPYYVGNNQVGNRILGNTETQGYTNTCYCTAKQLPRVEYTICGEHAGSTFLQCCEEKVSEGWIPLNANPYNSGTAEAYSQAFWRFAQ